MWTVEFYEKENGEMPVRDFILGLDPKMRAKAFREIDILKEFGTAIREPYSKHLGGGIHELRIKFASDICRVFYFFYIGDRIVLTNGFVKKTQKTPPQELERARKYKADYERRASK